MKCELCPPASFFTAETLKQPSDPVDVVTVLRWLATATQRLNMCVCVCEIMQPFPLHTTESASSCQEEAS